MKKKYILLLAAGACGIAAAVGGTLAAGNVASKTVLQEISEKSLGISIFSGYTNNHGYVNTNIEVMPGGTHPLNYRMVNDQENGYDLYARVRLYFDWMPETLAQKEEMNHYMRPVLQGKTIPLVKDYEHQVSMGDWIVVSCDSTEAVLYYTKPLAEGESVPILDEVSFAERMGNAYAKATFHLQVEVDAVQANQSADAIAAEWGVFPKIKQGVIVSVSETRK